MKSLKKIENVDKKYIISVNILRAKKKLNFSTRIAEVWKILPTKNQVETALDLGDQKIKKLQTFNISYFIGKYYFDGDGSQNDLIFHRVFKYF